VRDDRSASPPSQDRSEQPIRDRDDERGPRQHLSLSPCNYCLYHGMECDLQAQCIQCTMDLRPCERPWMNTMMTEPHIHIGSDEFVGLIISRDCDRCYHLNFELENACDRRIPCNNCTERGVVCMPYGTDGYREGDGAEQPPGPSQRRGRSGEHSEFEQGDTSHSGYTTSSQTMPTGSGNRTGPESSQPTGNQYASIGTYTR
jgi:hypothetical protein